MLSILTVSPNLLQPPRCSTVSTWRVDSTNVYRVVSQVPGSSLLSPYFLPLRIFITPRSGRVCARAMEKRQPETSCRVRIHLYRARESLLLTQCKRGMLGERGYIGRQALACCAGWAPRGTLRLAVLFHHPDTWSLRGTKHLYTLVVPSVNSSSRRSKTNYRVHIFIGLFFFSFESSER